MGKYMKKDKITGEAAAMEVSQRSSVGVRTRAKTLALGHLRTLPTSADSSYLQLRSRRLEKSCPPCKETPSPGPSALGLNSGSALRKCGSKKDAAEPKFLEDEAITRIVKETTPESIRIPSYRARLAKLIATNRKDGNPEARRMPASQEMEAYFAREEQRRLKYFSEKYNFDLVKDVPLPGPWEWVKVDDGGASSRQ